MMSTIFQRSPRHLCQILGVALAATLLSTGCSKDEKKALKKGGEVEKTNTKPVVPKLEQIIDPTLYIKPPMTAKKGIALMRAYYEAIKKGDFEKASELGCYDEEWLEAFQKEKTVRGKLNVLIFEMFLNRRHGVKNGEELSEAAIRGFEGGKISISTTGYENKGEVVWAMTLLPIPGHSRRSSYSFFCEKNGYIKLRGVNSLDRTPNYDMNLRLTYEAAFIHLPAECEKGDVKACETVGHSYHETGNTAKAKVFYLKAVKHSESLCQRAVKGANPGESSPQAFVCYRIGHAFAGHRKYGILTSYFDKQDRKKALTYFKKACELGDKDGCKEARKLEKR